MMHELDEAKRRAAEWAIREVAKACGTSPDLILSRPRSAPNDVKFAAFRGFRVAVGVMAKLGLSSRDAAAALGALRTTITNVRRHLRTARSEKAIVESIMRKPEALEFVRLLASTNSTRLLLDRMEALEQRVLALESGLRRLGNPDFRRLDALILAGWADIPQSNIPLEILVRALLGLPVPSPGQYGFQHSRAICDLSPISMNRAC